MEVTNEKDDTNGSKFIDINKIDFLKWDDDNRTIAILNDGKELMFGWNIDILANKLSGGKAITPPGYDFDENGDMIDDEDPGAIVW